MKNLGLTVLLRIIYLQTRRSIRAAFELLSELIRQHKQFISEAVFCLGLDRLTKSFPLQAVGIHVEAALRIEDHRLATIRGHRVPSRDSRVIRISRVRKMNPCLAHLPCQPLSRFAITGYAVAPFRVVEEETQIEAMKGHRPPT